MARPFLKWVGGKTQLLPELLKHVPGATGEYITPGGFGAYYEPFLGGGALFFELSRLGLLKHGAVLSDANKELINCYTQLRDHAKDVITELRYHSEKHSEKHYYALREANFEGALQDARLVRAARFIYINKAGYNGLWRVNRKGECNVPWGKHAKFEPDEENLIACADALRFSIIRTLGFEEALCEHALLEPSAGDLVYADPPYLPVSATANFTGYTKGGFESEHQMLLAKLLYRLARRGVHIIASNADVPACRELYGIFDLHEVQARRAVNCKGKKRGKVGELIITGGT